MASRRIVGALRILLLLTGAGGGGAVSADGVADAALDRWLDAQAGLTSWKSEFVQTRHLEALTQPLSAPGTVWFVAPDRFRWELGRPVRSIALRDGSNLWMLSPPLKRAERYELATVAQGPMKDALTLLDSGFPRNGAEFRKRFELLQFSGTNATWMFRLRPRSLATRRLLPALSLEVRTNDLALVASELEFSDGSRMRNDFTGSERNPSIPPDTFAPVLDPGWKITTPAAPR
ncbi:MAG: outer membrane lipoprotein carrier protein LolA [Verrucomicrobiales bacterium]|nr:outer membrane lipoprotein carrier protein LolA [Verrucomicrobiales bacterium]